MQLTAEQVNTFLADAVLESQIGQAVKEAVERTVVELRKSYNNPFDAVIRQHVHMLIETEVKTRYTEVLNKGVKEALATALTEDAVNAIIDSAMRYLRNK